MKKVNKFFKLFLTFLFTIATILNPISVLAANGNLEMGIPDETYATGEKHLSFMTNTRYNTVTFNDSSGNKEWAFLQEFRINGDIVYCIQPLVRTHNGYEYTEGSQPSYISPSQKRMLDKIAWYGYGYNGNTSDKRMFATQVAIWELMGVRVTNISQELRNEVDNINYLINNADNKPSFNGQSITLQGYGEEFAITLKDTNGVISSWGNNITVGNNDIKYSKNENELKIWATGGELTNINLTLKQGYNNVVLPSDDSAPKKMIFYLSAKEGETYQDICRLGDPYWNSGTIKVNVEPYGTFTLTKQDNKGNKVSGVKFKLSYNSDMSDPIGTYTTNSNGVITIERLLPKKVYYQEVSVPKHLVLDSSIKNINILSNKTVSSIVTNKWKQGYIKVTKKDEDTGKIVKKAGTTFEIYNSNNVKVSSIKTNNNGVATSGLLDYGTYYVKEANAPNKYTIKIEVSSNIGIVEDSKTYEITISNKRTTGTIILNKEDSVTGKKAQGEATLKGAIYKLYAREPILDPSDDKTVIYPKDKEVGILTTDENGDANISNLYLGKYYMKEISPSKGYTLDTSIYNIDLDYTNQTQKIETKKQTSKERVISQAFSIIKISNNGVSGETVTLEGAEFTIKSQVDINKYGSWENAPIAKNAMGQNAKVLVTDKQGYAESERLPYGKYVVRETKIPSNHSKVNDFIVNITKDSNEPQPWRVFNDLEFQAILAIVKQDKESLKTIQIPNARFKIKNLDTGNYFGYWEWNPLPHYVTEWVTNESGTVMTAAELKPGTYQLEEVQSPNGYLISKDPVKFTISSNVPYQTLPDGSTPVITVKFNDQAVKGKVTVEKKGEVLTSYKNGKFVYETRGLKGAEYEIYAKEDILDPSNDGTVLYKKDTLVTKLKTGDNGKATTDELPLGKYYSKEIKAPKGYVLDKENSIQDFELKYKDDHTALVYETLSYINERQKVEVSINKKDKDTNTLLQGAVFGLYNLNNIYDINDKLILEKGTLLETVTTNENGIGIFNNDLPIDEQFEIKEITPPIGYSSINETILINTAYQGQEKKVISFSPEFKNEIIKFDISKKDITNDEEISGAFLTIYPKNEPGSIIDSWISGSDGKNQDGTLKPHRITGLIINKTYVLKEINSPHGYAISKDVEFTVKDTGEVQSVEMKDEMIFGQLQWKKTGEIFKQVVTGQTEFGSTTSPIWKTSNLLGAEISIYAAEDITVGNHTYYKENSCVEILKSDLEVVNSKKLPVGKYYYKETKAPYGFILDSTKHYFDIKDNQINELQKINSTLINTRAKVNFDITKILEEQKIFKNKDSYKDIVFGIFAKEDIYDYMGNVAINRNSMIYTTGISKNGHLLSDNFDLPNGIYYIKELSTNSQYVLNDTEYQFEISYHGQDVSEYTVQISNESKILNKLARGSIQVVKKDSENTNKVLKNIEFNISANHDMTDIISTSQTNDKGIATFKDLELGTYYIQESKQIDGYTINDHVYKIEVTKDGDLLTVTCINTPTKMIFSKQDITTAEEIIGAHISVTEKETGKIIDEWISQKDPHIIKYLVEGKEYIMTENVAPNGYELAESITFTAQNNQTIIMKDKKKPVIVNTSDNNDSKKWFIISFITTSIILSLKRKRKNNNKK